jgi:predicted RNA-binding protein YlxR (DUF448 family)
MMTERTCIATRTVRPVDELIRFVVGPDGAVVPDILCKLPGRGVWVSADASLLEQAVRRDLFARAFKSTVTVSADLVQLVGDLLRRRALDLMGLARKAGIARTGFTKIVEQAGRGEIALLLHASDAAPDGVRKLTARIAALGGARTAPQTLTLFSCRELSLALGQSNVVHAALKEARLTDEIAAAARKFEDFWGGQAREQISA